MKTRLISLAAVFALLTVTFIPAFAIKMDGYNTDTEYGLKEYQVLFKNETDTDNNVTYALAFMKSEKTNCYILFNVVCNDVDENKAEYSETNNKTAGVIITAEGETLKADLSGTDYGGYDENKIGFEYCPKVKSQGFSIETRINFKDGIGDGKTITVKFIDGGGKQSPKCDMTITPPVVPPTASAVTTKTTTEKTTKEKTTKPTTEKTTKEKTTKEKTTKPTTTKPETAKSTAAPETRTKREITHRAVTTTKKRQPAVTTSAEREKTSKATTTKFRAQGRNDVEAETRQSTSERRTGLYPDTVTYTYITEEYTTSPAKAGSGSISKKKIAALASATLVIAACALGTVAKKDKQDDDNKKSEGS